MKTRFAPSPTGPLHLGHAFSAITAYNLAQTESGEFLLRIEDIDQTRARADWEEQIYTDLKWLGLSWPDPVMRQSERQKTYEQVLDRLWNDGLLFECDCSRRDIKEAASAPQEGGAPVIGADGIVYPGTCRDKPRPPRRPALALRLNMAKAVARVPKVLKWAEFGEDGGVIEIATETLIENIGDVVLARRDMGVAYHLAVVIDDAEQEISHVVRGADLQPATPIHVLLQHLLNLPVPDYHHHRLIRDETGKRLAKRDDARAIGKYRDDGFSPNEIRNLIGL